MIACAGKPAYNPHGLVQTNLTPLHQELSFWLERLKQSDEEADALEVGAAGDALVGAVDAAITLVVINHKGREANALRANVLELAASVAPITVEGTIATGSNDPFSSVSFGSRK